MFCYFAANRASVVKLYPIIWDEDSVHEACEKVKSVFEIS